MGTVRNLSCCVCGEDAGQFEQHWNRDTGYGVCASCVALVRSRGETEAGIRSLYGVEGVNFAGPMMMVGIIYGDDPRALAEG